MKHKRWLAGLAVSALLLGACGSDDDDGGGADTTVAPNTTVAPDGSEAPDSSAAAGGDALTELGEGEGEVNLIAWAGYVEDGSTDPEVDWVTGFEEETGCSVNVKLGNTSDEMVALMQSGEYDGVSASGDATLRLIQGGEVSPVNTDLIPNYADVFPDLKDQPHNTVDGVPYGVPHGRGANLLVYNTDEFSSAPDSWVSVFDADSPAKGGVSVYDSPIYIADAALYLMATQPDLGIENPYALDETQFAAAVDLLNQQKDLAGQYWSLYTDQQAALEAGSVKAGTTWQVIVNLAQGNGAKIDAVKPTEGATGWSDTWMISSKAQHPNCMYMWMNHIISPEANAGVAEWFGEAPSNAKSCALTADPEHCATFHAEETDYWTDVWYWTTPTSTCLDGRDAGVRAVHGVGERLERAPGLTVPTVAAPAGPGNQTPARPAGLGRGASRFFRRHPWASLAALLTWPLLWLIVIYLGSLAVLVVSVFFSIDEFTNQTTTDLTMANVEEVLGTGAYWDTVIRSIGVAAAVTLLSLVIALPLAFYIAKLAKPWARRGLIVSATLPLWAGYLVKAYAMRAVFEPGGSSGGGGFLQGAIGWTPGFGLPAVVLTLTYLWVPYMILPIYAGLDRLPSSLLDASGDLGGRPFRTFRSVILPLLVPAIAAGSIFTFSLSLGDYITVKIVGSKTQLIGNLIERTLLAPNVPLAAAFTLWPIVIMIAYLFVMARLGAFESL